MRRVLIAPCRYVQGPGVLVELGGEIRRMGTRALVVGGQRALAGTRSAIESGARGAGVEVALETFGGECTEFEIERIAGLARKHRSQVVVGVGGGKAIDTAKAAAHAVGVPVVVAPTIAATDAPCSALYDVYTAEGAFARSCELPWNPSIVLVDSEVIARAPARLLVAGMGDALSTWFEADACARSSARNVAGGHSTVSALRLARLSYELLFEYGEAARLACERDVPTEALERIIEVNVLISGIGFESSGLAASHAVHDGITLLPATRGSYHGERVAFATLVQLVMENRPVREMDEVLHFMVQVGLPVTLAQIGLVDASTDDLGRAAEFAARPNTIIHNMPMPVDAATVYRAILGADAIGQDFLRRRSAG